MLKDSQSGGKEGNAQKGVQDRDEDSSVSPVLKLRSIQLKGKGEGTKQEPRSPDWLTPASAAFPFSTEDTPLRADLGTCHQPGLWEPGRVGIAFG